MHRLLKWTAALLAAGALLLWPEATFDGHRTFAESRAAKDNLHLLAQVVCGEARGEPYEGKVAVAAVILNRTLDNRFPDSVAGVVYQTHAFESVSNGEIYKETTEECFKAARAALAGWDPSNGRSTSSPRPRPATPSSGPGSRCGPSASTSSRSRGSEP
ncbi:MAG: spore cortex-lytic protein [Symbiobacterium thermophilum]|uniref:Spore cortex-lytic protein n=1 Tax=Symbiobacterium thermophilum TaxID=2734 RepID=A0A1Y2T743_SYMTR|nr:MAG: spore cortex-lytic protein [Symbiobacterium thermophilum]